MKGIFNWFGVAVALTAPLLCAQEPTKPAEVEGTYRAEWVRWDRDNDLLIAVGHVQLRFDDVWLRCESAVIWTSSATDDEPDQGNDQETRIRIREVYAEGGVLFERGREVIDAHSAFLDTRARRGVFFSAAFSTRVDARDGEVVISARADEIRQIARDRFEFQEVWATTSPFAEPSYRLHTDWLTIQIDPPAPRPDRPDQTTRNIRYSFDGTVLYLGDVPVLATPAYSGNTAARFGYSWIRDFSVGSSSKFGPSVRATVGSDISFDDEPWGEWRLHTQYLGDRGPGAGLDVRYRTETYRGEVEGFYQNDRGKDELFGEPPDHDRGRVTWRHRHQLPEDIQLDLELSRISDRGYLPEYFESEFQSGKDQETLLYFKRAQENRALTLLASTRLNEFQTQNEHLPRLGYDLFSEPLIELGDVTLYFDADYEVSNARRRFDDALGINDQNAFRADLDNVVTLPFFAGPIKLEPFAGFRYTRYSNGRVAETAIDRIGTTYGVRATTQLSRTYDVGGGPFDLYGLRHVILPEIEYRAIDHVSRDPDDLVQIDDIDAFDARETITIGVRNRLQTIWDPDDEPRVVDLVDLDLEWTYFPQAARDNFGEHAGNFDLDFVLRPTPRLTYLLDFEYSFVLDTMEILNSTVAWLASEELQLTLSYRRHADDYDAVFIGAQWRPSERLGFAIQSGYDLEDGRFQDQELTIRRIGADWVFEIELHLDNSDDFGFGIAIIPRALFDPRLKFRGLRQDPQFASFGQGILR